MDVEAGLSRFNGANHADDHDNGFDFNIAKSITQVYRLDVAGKVVTILKGRPRVCVWHHSLDWYFGIRSLAYWRKNRLGSRVWSLLAMLAGDKSPAAKLDELEFAIQEAFNRNNSPHNAGER